MKTNLLRKIKSFLIILGFTSLTASATDGYFSTGYGTINKGLAGAGIAYYQGSLINGNPAGVVLLGKKYHIGVDFFNPNRSFSVYGAPSQLPLTFGLAEGTVPSGSRYFVIPSLGANWVINDISSFSVALFGNGGMNTDFPPGGFGDFEAENTGVNLAQLFSNFTYSVMLSDNHSIGITATLGYQYFETDGLAGFANLSRDSNKLSGNGTSNSFGYGVKVGYLGKLTETFSIGAMYQSKVYMSEFDEYAGLFAEKGDFDVPASWTIGFSWDVNDEFTLMGDAKQILYEGVKSISNPLYIIPTDPTTYLGEANGPGFGWEDMTVFKLGISYSGYDSWTLRGGYSFGTNPIPDSEVLFNILSPGVITNQVAVGFTKNLEKKRRGRYSRNKSDGKQLHLAVNYAMENSVTGTNPLDPTSGQTIEIGMSQIELEIGFSF